jgi:hypothetical protein
MFSALRPLRGPVLVLSTRGFYAALLTRSSAKLRKRDNYFKES